MIPKERGKNRRMQPWILIVIFIVLWVGFNFAKNAVGNYKLRQDIIALERRLQVLELRGEELQKEIVNWQSPENIERVAREELGLVKPGEVVYILTQPLEDEVDFDVQKR